MDSERRKEKKGVSGEKEKKQDGEIREGEEERKE